MQADLPYIIESLSIPEGKELKIKEGQVIKFLSSSNGMSIDGKLTAVGSPDKKIVFTSIKDDNYGEDTNNDSGKYQPGPGSWKGIYFSPKSRGSRLENVNILYAGGYYSSYSPCKPDMSAVKVDDSEISIINSLISNSERNGLYLINSSVEIKNSEISNTDYCWADRQYNVKYGGNGIYMDEGGKLNIENSVIKSNKNFGVFSAKGEVSFSELIFGEGEEKNGACNLYVSDQGGCLLNPKPEENF